MCISTVIRQDWTHPWKIFRIRACEGKYIRYLSRESPSLLGILMYIYLVAHTNHLYLESRRNAYTDTVVAVTVTMLKNSCRILFQTLIKINPLYIWIKNVLSKITIQSCSLKRQVSQFKHCLLIYKKKNFTKTYNDRTLFQFYSF